MARKQLKAPTKHFFADIIMRMFFNRSITTKITVVYIVIFIVCILCNATIARLFYSKQMKSAITELESQTMENISQNVDNSLTSVSKSSTYLLGTSEVQEYLQNSYHAVLAKNLRNSLYLTLESIPLADSIFVINEDGTYESASRYTKPKILLSSPKEADWYDDIHRLKGKPSFYLNGDGYFSSGDKGSNYFTLIRLINSTVTARPLGYLMINIPMNSLLSFAQKDNKSYSNVCVYAQGNIIYSSLNDSLKNYFSNFNPDNIPAESDIHVNNERYLLLNFYDQTYEWNYLSAINYNNFSNETKPFLSIFIFTIIISAILFLFIAFSNNLFITAPIHRLIHAMKKTENGNFKPVCITQYKDEISLLQDTYNEMIAKIQNLLETTIQEQKLIRKAELNILQEQIKPHFLYNSLSAIAYLVSSRQNETAHEMILSLSEYYRESLSKGNEIVTISTEINIVKNYLKLQKMRFPDLFEDIYEIQEDTLNLPVPRLFLQPLAENSLLHGIIPTGEYGTIKIQVYKQNEALIIRISDDGIGMSPEKLSQVLDNNLFKNVTSFGLRGTVERLQIFFEAKNIYQIKSIPQHGTEIIITLPLNKWEEPYESE